MARKSALENWQSTFEGDEGSNQVDINVIIEAEGEAAEDILDAQASAEDEATAVAEESAEESAQAEVEEMAEMAAALREHGLNPGMAAVLSITMPLEFYGVSMPGKESLDAAGRNQNHAERIAAALEAKGDGFWAGTKDFFRRAWERIKAIFAWIANKITGLKSRIKRAKDSLSGRVYDSEAAKSEKNVEVIDDADFLKSIGAFSAKVRDTASGLQNIEMGSVNDIAKKYPDPAVVKAITGCAYKEEDGLPVGLDEADKKFLDTKSESLSSSMLDDYRGTHGKNMLDMAEAYEEMGKFGKNLKGNMKIVEGNVSFDDNKSGATDATKEANKKALGILRRRVTMFATVLTKANSSCFKVGNNYVAVCAKLRKVSKAG